MNEGEEKDPPTPTQTPRQTETWEGEGGPPERVPEKPAPLPPEQVTPVPSPGWIEHPTKQASICK